MHRPYDDDGFTLVELMVVVLVIGLLIAIALPTYLGARNRSYNRAAQSDLRSALVAAKAIYSNSATYACVLAAATVPCPQALPQFEPSLIYTTAASTTALPSRVSVMATPTNLVWTAARMSLSGTCFRIRDVPMGAPPSTVGTWYGQSTTNCSGLLAATVANTALKKWT